VVPDSASGSEADRGEKRRVCEPIGKLERDYASPFGVKSRARNLVPSIGLNT
jgi:hypothetical protein